ncbi:MAG: hypothetical protein E7365_04975 [Clostridiales bacterium]|nr:hypothetical protein [Clostridiales bacterium]
MEQNKKELITKLRKISELFETVVEIKTKMDNYDIEDNYSRKHTMPEFNHTSLKKLIGKDVQDRLEYAASNNGIRLSYFMVDNFEEYQRLKSLASLLATKAIFSLDDEGGEYPSDEEALSYADELYKEAIPAPKEPDLKKHEEIVTVAKFKSKGLLIVGCIWAGMSLMFMFDSFLTGLIMLLLCSPLIIIYILKIMKAKKEATNAFSEAKANYITESEKYNEEHNLFLSKFVDWRKEVKLYVEEENEISQKIEKEKADTIEKINNEEYIPACEKLVEFNDLLPQDYLPAINQIIELLENNRADNLKEAINLYEDIVFRQEQEEQRQYEEEIRRQDEERRYQEEKSFREQQERQRQREEKRRFDAEEKFRQTQEYNRQREAKAMLDEERRKNNLAASSRVKRCHACANQNHCRIKNLDSAYNCTGFRPL